MLLRGAGRGGDELVIGLVNNMPPAAMRQTEEQFLRLLQDASAGLVVRLRCFASGPTVRSCDEDIGALWSSRLDGLIVTGAEPRAEQMSDEPLWPLLSRLTEWAAANTRAAMFSCLAAHAAVFQLCGVPRRRLPAKLSGVYACGGAAPHPWMADAPGVWPVPHSRHNDLHPGALQAAGFQILSTGPAFGEADGADSFACSAGQSQFLMLQGHPEYGVDSLLREYRRDIRRYLAGHRGDWPAMPVNYFDGETEAALAQFGREAGGRAPGNVTADVMAAFEACMTHLPVPLWQSRGAHLFSAWLETLALRAVEGGQALALAVS